MAYIWQTPNEFPSSWIGDYDANISPDRFLLRRGERMADNSKLATVRFRVKTDRIRKFHVLPNNAMVPLVSDSVITAFQGVCEADFEPVAAKVVTADGSLSQFSFLNVLARVEAIDIVGSECLMFPGTRQVMKFERLRLVPSAIGCHHLARDPRYASYIFVSDEIKELCDRMQWLHCTFRHPDDVRP